MKISKKIVFATEDAVAYALRSVPTNPALPTPSICGTATTIECRVNTTGNILPYAIEEGNIVYDGLTGSTLFDGLDLHYKIVLSNAEVGEESYFCQINNVGEVIAVALTCPIL